MSERRAKGSAEFPMYLNDEPAVTPSRVERVYCHECSGKGYREIRATYAATITDCEACDGKGYLLLREGK